MSLRKKLTMAALMGVLSLMFAGNALATNGSGPSLYRPFPEGLPAHNAPLDWQLIQGRASWDTQYAAVIAKQAGAPSFVAGDYKAVGYRNGMPGTSNSALSGAGAIVPLADHAGSGTARVVVVMNIKTKKLVAFMVRCGNPRLSKTPYVVPIPWHPFRKTTVIRIHRTISKPVQITCPSGQKVSGTLNVVFNGVISGATWGKVQGSLNAKLQVGFQAQIKAFVNLKCGPAPAPPPPTPTAQYTATATATANASASCADGTTATASGYGFATATSNVSQADAQAKATAAASALAQANANAAIKCGSAPPPATCPSGQTGTPPNCVTPPPGNFTVTGSTSVQGSKELNQACPAPNQGTVKTGSGAASLTSPTFIGSGTTQQAAQDNLNSQLNNWKSQNQSVVDQQALAQAQSNLNSALQTCPSTPPPTPPSLSNLTQPQEVYSDGETYPNIRVTSSATNGHSITVSCGAHYGSMSGTQTFTSGGVDTLSFTYTSPNATDAAGLTETITCNIHDNTTGLSGQPVSVSFPIQAPPSNPG